MCMCSYIEQGLHFYDLCIFIMPEIDLVGNEIYVTMHINTWMCLGLDASPKFNQALQL